MSFYSEISNLLMLLRNHDVQGGVSRKILQIGRSHDGVVHSISNIEAIFCKKRHIGHRCLPWTNPWCGFSSTAPPPIAAGHLHNPVTPYRHFIQVEFQVGQKSEF